MLLCFLKERIEWAGYSEEILNAENDPLIVLAALLAAPTAFAQSQGQDQSKSAQGYKPSADTPAKQKERNGDYSKTPGMPGNKSGPPAQQNRQKRANVRECIGAVQVDGLKLWQSQHRTSPRRACGQRGQRTVPAWTLVGNGAYTYDGGWMEKASMAY
jgi:hypothetical protein